MMNTQSRLKALTVKCARMRREARQQIGAERVEELWEAWSRRDLAEVGRLSRLLAGTQLGRRRRNYRSAWSPACRLDR
eukprot:2222609-Pyramimonas_sp.AAC.1